MATRKGMADWSLTELLDRIAELDAKCERQVREIRNRRIEELKAENHTFRMAQKACEDCDAPTMKDIEELNAKCERQVREIRNLDDLHKRRIEALKAEVHLAFYEGFESKRIDPDLAWDASNAKAALQEQGND